VPRSGHSGILVRGKREVYRGIAQALGCGALQADRASRARSRLAIASLAAAFTVIDAAGNSGAVRRPKGSEALEREMGFEPTTSCLEVRV